MSEKLSPPEFEVCNFEDLPQFNPEPFAVSDRVKIIENCERMVDVRVYCPAVDATRARYPFLRKTVADMLNHAAGLMPDGYTLKVTTCYRTLEMQARGYWNSYNRYKEEHPEWPLSVLRSRVNRFHAPPDRKSPPGHCTGAAIDLQIVGPDGNPLNMWSPYEWNWKYAQTYSGKIDEQARRNRALLVRAMTSAGFSNCTAEWWHYSWGDSAWAARVGAKTCCYGLAANIGDPNLAEWVARADEAYEWRQALEKAKKEAEEAAQKAAEEAQATAAL